MDLESLRLLADVARLGSIGAAGRTAGISQQSASERLRALETRTGVPLLDRDARGSRLTEQGRLVVAWSRELLEAADELEETLETLRAPQSHVLRVAASMTTAEFLVPGWLVRLRRHQQVTVSLQASNSDQVLAAVRAGEAAIGFIEGPAHPAGLNSAVVGHDELVLVAAPDDPWATRRSVGPRTLASRPLTQRDAGSGGRAVTERAFAAAGVTPVVPEAEVATNAAVAASIRAGGAPGFLSRRVVERDLALGTLVLVRTTGMSLDLPFTAVWPGPRTPPAGPVRDLLAIARASRST